MSLTLSPNISGNVWRQLFNNQMGYIIKQSEEKVQGALEVCNIKMCLIWGGEMVKLWGIRSHLGEGKGGRECSRQIDSPQVEE